MGFWWPENPAGSWLPLGRDPVSVCPSPYITRQDRVTLLFTDTTVKVHWTESFSEEGGKNILCLVGP